MRLTFLQTEKKKLTIQTKNENLPSPEYIRKILTKYQGYTCSHKNDGQLERKLAKVQETQTEMTSGEGEYCGRRNMERQGKDMTWSEQTNTKPPDTDEGEGHS